MNFQHDGMRWDSGSYKYGRAYELGSPFFGDDGVITVVRVGVSYTRATVIVFEGCIFGFEVVRATRKSPPKALKPRTSPIPITHEGYTNDVSRSRKAARKEYGLSNARALDWAEDE